MVCRQLNIEKIMRAVKQAMLLNPGMAAGEARASLIHTSRVAYEQCVPLPRKVRPHFRESPLLRVASLLPFFVGRARNENCYCEPFLFNKERQDCSVQVGCNLELLSLNQDFLPSCMLPAIVLILDLSVELTGEPLAQNGGGRHEEGKVTLRVHKIP
jgi:hypothetical protein